MKILSFFCFALSLTLLGCATTPKEINMSKLSNKTFKVTEFSYFVRQDMDQEHLSKGYLQKVFPATIKQVAEAVLAKEGAVLDVEQFSADLTAGHFVEEQPIDFGGKVKADFFSWKSKELLNQDASMSFPFAIDETGNVTIYVTLYQKEADGTKAEKSIPVVLHVGTLK